MKHVEGRICNQGTLSRTKVVDTASHLVAAPSTFQCDECKKFFMRKYNLHIHSRNNICTKTYNTFYTCKVCAKTCSSVSTLKKHMSTHRVKHESVPTQGNSESAPIQGNSLSESGGNNRPNKIHSSPELIDANTPEESGYSQYNEESRPQRRSSKFENTHVLYRLSTVEAEKYDIMYFFGNRCHQLKINIQWEMNKMRAVK